MRKNLSRCALKVSGSVFFLSMIEICAYSQTQAPDLLDTLPPAPTEEMRQMQNAQQVQDSLQLQKAQQQQKALPKQEKVETKEVKQTKEQAHPKREQAQPKQEKVETKEVTQTKEQEQPQKQVKPQEQQQTQTQTKVEKVEKTKTVESAQEKNNLQNTPPPEEKNLPTKVKNPPEEGSGLFGSAIRIGPMVGIGVLMGPNVGIEAKIFKNWVLSFSYAQYSKFNIFSVYDFRSQLNNNNKDFTIDSAHVDYKQIEGKISWFPWGKTFFIGTAFGKRDITVNMGGNVNATIPELGSTPLTAPINVEYSVSSLYVTPQIGCELGRSLRRICYWDRIWSTVFAFKFGNFNSFDVRYLHTLFS